jgi:hypothetical protein
LDLLPLTDEHVTVSMLTDPQRLCGGCGVCEDEIVVKQMCNAGDGIAAEERFQSDR